MERGGDSIYDTNNNNYNNNKNKNNNNKNNNNIIVVVVAVILLRRVTNGQLGFLIYLSQQPNEVGKNNMIIQRVKKTFRC